MYYQTIALIWRENMLRYLSADITCSEKSFSNTQDLFKIGKYHSDIPQF